MIEESSLKVTQQASRVSTGPNSVNASSRQRIGSLRIVPCGRDIYNRLLADVFVNEQYEETHPS